MVQRNRNDNSREILSKAFRLAESHDWVAVRSTLETNSDSVEVSRHYADLAQALYNDRKQISQMLAVAKLGVQYCLDAAQRMATKDTAAAKILKNNAKVIAYNAAANSWPGWGDEGVVIEQPHISEATGLAERSLQLVEELKLGDYQLGNGHWLVGALLIAGGQRDEAIAALTHARNAFCAAGNHPTKLMALGYLALASRDRAAAGEASDELEDVCRQLQQDGSADAVAYIQQLRTASFLL